MASETWNERTPEGRALAERALARLLFELRDGSPIPVVVLGGLVPETLVDAGDAEVSPHLGTADIDVLVVFQVDDAEDVSHLERALEAMRFEPDPSPGYQWRWVGRLNDVRVKFEFLCDVDGVPAQTPIRLAGCHRLSACNLRGTGFVAEDSVLREIEYAASDGGAVKVSIRFAGLEGYLLAKGYACMERGLEKDYYDFAYVLLFNRLGGPVQAAQALANGVFADRLANMTRLWRELEARFDGSTSIGAVSYANQAILVTPEEVVAILRQDAVGAVIGFLSELGY